LITLAIAALAMQKRMKSLGSFPLKGALEVIFSFRDLRAISLLDKLDKAEDSHEEELLLGALHDTPSRLAVDGLLERARSPRLATRLEAIRALEKMDKLNEKAQKALIDDVKNNPYTTAYISARILGNQHCKAAVSLLREYAVSDDYMLAGEAVTALAKMNDESFRPEIEKIVLQTKNPRLKIMCAEALGHYRHADSISVLFDILRSDNPPPYLRDEVILAIASILNIQRVFYKILARYTADNSLESALAADEADSALEFVNSNVSVKKKVSKEKIDNIISCAESLQKAAECYVAKNDGADLSRWILELPEINKSAGIVKSVFSEAVLDTELNIHSCLRLLIIHWAAQELRVWAMKVK
jgi:HEAT repeat protein